MMIRNLPQALKQRTLLRVLDTAGFANKYDFVYLPFSLMKKQNLGYAFVNFLSRSDAQSFRRAWNGSTLLNSNKIYDDGKVPSTNETEGVRPLSVKVANVQGKEANVQRLLNEYRSTKITNRKFQPVVFEHGVRVDFSQLAQQAEEKKCPINEV